MACFIFPSLSLSLHESMSLWLCLWVQLSPFSSADIWNLTNPIHGLPAQPASGLHSAGVHATQHRRPGAGESQEFGPGDAGGWQLVPALFSPSHCTVTAHRPPTTAARHHLYTYRVLLRSDDRQTFPGLVLQSALLCSFLRSILILCGWWFQTLNAQLS